MIKQEILKKTGIISYGIECELDIDNKTITLLESVVEVVVV